MKKKILMVCESFGGGVFSYVSQLCNDMADDYDVYLAYSLRPQTPDNYMSFLDRRVHRIRMRSFSQSGYATVFRAARVIRELRKIKKEVQPDIIHLHSSIAGGLGRIAFSGKDCRLVYTPHGYAHVLQGPGKKSRLYERIEKILGRRDCITLTCCESEDRVARKLCPKTAYIETGINLEDLSKDLDEVIPEKNERFTVYTLGRVTVQKQPALFNRIAELVPEARFIWIGNGELEELLTAPNLEVTGWKPRKEALAMAKGADAFVLCSYGEAISMSLIENMFIKKLVMVSDVMGNNSVIHDSVNGYICRTAEEYADRIRSAMKKFPQDLVERAYKDVIEIYNTDVMKKKYLQFYDSLLGGSN